MVDHDDTDDAVAPSERSRLISPIPGTIRGGLYYPRKISRFLENHVPSFGQHGNLSESWDYFENFVLPRRYKDTKQKANPGTPVSQTELYPAWSTPQSSLSEFGIGIAVYFGTLRALFVIFLIAFLLYLPSIIYYASDPYDEGKISIWNVFLKGSLMCVSTQWVPCVDCTVHDVPGDRLARSISGHLFILKNACAEMRLQEGINHLIVIVFLVVSMVYLGFYQKKLELKYDEDVLTAQDYSIVVLNPPRDAVSVDEWKSFFSQFGEVVYCTICLNNERLVQKLVERRVTFLQAIHQDVRPKKDPVPLNVVPDEIRVTHPKLAQKCDAIEKECQLLLESTYEAIRLFVTFETEHAQRRALDHLSVSKLTIVANDTDSVRPELLFRNQHILKVREAVEPSEVRWKDLNESTTVRLLKRFVASIIILLLLYGALKSVAGAFTISTRVAAILIACFSAAVPSTLFATINVIESHESESSFQASLFAKHAVFRFVNTAVATSIIKPFTYTAAVGSTSLIPAIYAVLQAETIVTPLSNMFDPTGQFHRHFLAPLAKNQIAMNSHFRGSVENFGDKYSNMMKIVFVCFFYSVIFPSGFLFGAFAIAATYVTDRFLLVRRWAPMPELGNDVAGISRRFVVPFCLVTLIVVSECYWSAFPFDDVCDADETISSASIPNIVGDHVLTTFEKQPQTYEVAVHENDPLYRFCDQDYLAHLTGLFVVFGKNDEWMSADQQWLTFLFGIVCVAVVVGLLVVAFTYEILPIMKGVTKGGFSTKERDSGQLYSSQENIKAYIPQEPHPSFLFPLLACDIENVKKPSHIGWVDPLRDHQYYNLNNDVDFLLGGKKLDRPVLGVIG